MLREMLQGKLHQGAVTACKLDYPGSLTVDQDLLDAAGILVHQKIQLVNCNNGARLETYTIPGERGKGEIIVNGAAARLAMPGDRVIVIAYAIMDEAEIRQHRPKVVLLDGKNRIVQVI